MTIQKRAITSSLAVIALALLLAIAALSAASDDRCADADDYDMCVLRWTYVTGGHGTPTPQPTNTGQGSSWQSGG